MKLGTGCPKKHGNSETNSISSLLWIRIVISDIYNGSTRWLVKTDKFTLVCILQFSYFTKYNRMQLKHKQTNCKTKQTKLLQITAFSVGINILNQRIIFKDDIEFVTEFPCLMGHPVCRAVFFLMFFISKGRYAYVQSRQTPLSIWWWIYV